MKSQFDNLQQSVQVDNIKKLSVIKSGSIDDQPIISPALIGPL